MFVSQKNLAALHKLNLNNFSVKWLFLVYILNMKRGIGYLALSLFFSGAAHATTQGDAVAPDLEISNEIIRSSESPPQAPALAVEQAPRREEMREEAHVGEKVIHREENVNEDRTPTLQAAPAPNREPAETAQPQVHE